MVDEISWNGPPGVVYWLTGLPGAGKTTLGKRLHRFLLDVDPKVVFLDGDALRAAIGRDVGYKMPERRRLAFQYAGLCRLLADQGMSVVCATVSMFHDVRAWNRVNISRYCEIYIKASMKDLKERNQKNLYSSGAQDVPGLDLEVELPRRPDLILNNGRHADLAETCATMISFVADFVRRVKE